MDGIIDANRTAQAFAGQTARSYRRLTDHTVGLQEENVRFFRNLFEECVRQARHQSEANLAMTQELFEGAEDQREALRRLTENVMHAYWSFAVSSMGRLVDTGSLATSEAVAPVTESVAFPIPGYARLTSVQVIEKLDGLSVEELKKVRAYEMEHKSRKALLVDLERRIQPAR